VNRLTLSNPADGQATRQPFRTRVYHASLTLERGLVLCAVGLGCIAVIGYGIGANMAGSSAGNGFMGLGLVLMILAGFFLGRGHRTSLKITEDSLTWSSGDDSLTIPWKKIREYQADPPGRRWFRSAQIGDGARTVVVSSYIFREYDQIVSLLDVAVRTHWKGAGQARPE